MTMIILDHRPSHRALCQDQGWVQQWMEQMTHGPYTTCSATLVLGVVKKKKKKKTAELSARTDNDYIIPWVQSAPEICGPTTQRHAPAKWLNKHIIIIDQMVPRHVPNQVQPPTISKAAAPATRSTSLVQDAGPCWVAGWVVQAMKELQGTSVISFKRCNTGSRWDGTTSEKASPGLVIRREERRQFPHRFS